jgi:hypothetical protein
MAEIVSMQYLEKLFKKHVTALYFSAGKIF